MQGKRRTHILQQGALRVVLGRLGSVSGLGTVLRPLCAVFDRFGGLCWWSESALGLLWAVLGYSWGTCWRSEAALGALWAILGRSWVPS